MVVSCFSGIVTRTTHPHGRIPAVRRGDDGEGVHAVAVSPRALDSGMTAGVVRGRERARRGACGSTGWTGGGQPP